MRSLVFAVTTVTLVLFLISPGALSAEEPLVNTPESTTIDTATTDTTTPEKEMVDPPKTETGSAENDAEITTETASKETPEEDAPKTDMASEKPTEKAEDPAKQETVLKTLTKPKKPSPWQITGRSESIVEWKDDNNATSEIDKETYWRQELSLGIRRKLEEGSMGLNMRGRATDDEAVDDQDARLLYLNGYYRTKAAAIEFGDVAASYNPLVLSASLKGTKMSYKKGDSRKGWKASILGGIQKASWDDIYGSDSDDAYDRYVAGTHNEHFFGTGKKLSLSTAFVTETDNSSADDATREFENPVEAATLGAAWDWRFNRYITTRGEAAFTSTDANTDDSISDNTAGAVRIKLMTKPHKKYFKTNFSYERIETDFAPFAASAAADRERISNDSTIMFNRKVKLRVTLKESRDNLDGELFGTRRTDDGVVYLTLRPDWLRRGDFNLRSQFKRNHGRGADQRLNIHQFDFSIRPKSGWKYGLSWIYTDINEKTVGMEDQDINTLRTTIGWKKPLLSDHMFRSTLQLDGNYIERDSGRQKAAGGKIDVGYDAGKFWSADLSANTKKTYRDISDDSQYTAYEFRGSYHPGGDRSKALRLSASKRQTFSGSETTNTENRAKVSYLFSF